MRACTPDRDGFVDCDGVKVFYEVFGDSGSPTVVLVNGFHIAHSKLWKAQVAYLARHFRVVTYDPPGNGRSDSPDDLSVYTAESLLRTLQAVLAATCPAPPVLVGISGGAKLAFMQAGANPASVAGVVLISYPWFVPPDSELFEPAAMLPHLLLLAELRDRIDDDEAWERFADGFYRGAAGVFPEPHSTKEIEDGIIWARTAHRPGMIVNTGAVVIAEAVASFDLSGLATIGEEQESLANAIECPALIVHGTADFASSANVARHYGELMGADVLIVEDGGHCPQNRDPVVINRAIRDFVERVHPPAPRARAWSRAITRPKRALFLCSPIGLGHARRDLAIAGALRAERPDLQIDWLAQHPVTAMLEAAGERVHGASRALVSESAYVESECGEHDLHAFQALRRMDEVLVANFMVFDDVMRDEPYDLVVADEAWDVDYFLHENPELKRFAYAWLTDFVGYLPMDDGEAWLTADYNAEMVEQVARYPRLRDRALFVGDADDIVPDMLGPGLPSIAGWTGEHFEFPGYITGFELEDRDTLRAELGYKPDETVCIVSVGGSGVGAHLLAKAVAAHAIAAKTLPSLRTIVVCGPRIDPASIDAPEGVEVQAFVPDLHRHLQACDAAIVQGGLTTCMELTAARRPFLYFPLANHFEQQRHVAHRLDRHRAGHRMSYRDSTPDSIAATLVSAISSPIDYLPVASDGASRAGQLLADLV